MKSHRQVTSWVLSLSLTIGLLGCATKKVDWGARVGSYTHDQAVTELGPPDRSAKLSDGSTVAEWLASRGLRTSHYSGGYSYHAPYYGHRGFYGGPEIVVESSSPDSFIRLTFDKDGKLVTWKRVAR